MGIDHDARKSTIGGGNFMEIEYNTCGMKGEERFKEDERE